MKNEIRFAKNQDIPQLLILLHQVGDIHHHLRPDLFRRGALKYDEGSLSLLLRDPTRPILVYLRDGELVGYAFCILRETVDDPVLADRREVYIDDLCVDEAARGQGVASKLYRAVVAMARSLHADAVTLNVWEGNDAKAFYEKMGLKPQKTGMEMLL